MLKMPFDEIIDTLISEIEKQYNVEAECERENGLKASLLLMVKDSLIQAQNLEKLANDQD